MSHLRHSAQLKSMYKRRNTTHTGINLVSLMDIFTILVFFLLVNSSDVEVLPSSKTVQLPQSMAEKKPKQTLTLVIDKDNITLQGRPVASVKAIMASNTDVVPGLKEELDFQLKKQLARHDSSKPFKGKVTIMGDKNIPYSLLKKIMLTCTKSKFTRISLAVVQKLEEQG